MAWDIFGKRHEHLLPAGLWWRPGGWTAEWSRWPSRPSRTGCCRRSSSAESRSPPSWSRCTAWTCQTCSWRLRDIFEWDYWELAPQDWREGRMAQRFSSTAIHREKIEWQNWEYFCQKRTLRSELEKKKKKESLQATGNYIVKGTRCARLCYTALWWPRRTHQKQQHSVHLTEGEKMCYILLNYVIAACFYKVKYSTVGTSIRHLFFALYNSSIKANNPHFWLTL